MQWNDGPHAGLRTCPADRLSQPVIEDEVFGYKNVNAQAQASDPDSLLNWTRKALAVRSSTRSSDGKSSTPEARQPRRACLRSCHR